MIAIKNVLVPTDFSEPAVAAVKYGRMLATQFSATLHVLHVVEDLALKTITAEGFTSYMPDLQREIEEAARKRLDSAVADAGTDGGASSRLVTSNTRQKRSGCTRTRRAST
jgi:nucleotide-binding universal stress UspA family protein